MMRRYSSRLSCVRALAAALLLATLVVAAPPQAVGAAPPAASFASPIAIPTGGTPQTLLLHDFNGDGWDDAVIGLQGTSTVLFYRNNNGNGFFPPISYTVGTGNPAVN